MFGLIMLIGFYGDTIITNNSYSMFCHQCPAGAQCDRSGLAFANLAASNGWWRSDNESLSFVKCLRASHCVDNQCAPNREGVLCSICSPGYRAASVDDACTPCPTKKASWGYTVGFTILLLFGLGVLYWAMAREQPSSAYIAAQRDLRMLSITALSEGRSSMSTSRIFNGTSGAASDTSAGSSAPGTPKSPSVNGPILNQSVDRTLMRLQAIDNEYNPSIVMTRERRVRPNFT